MKRLLLFLLALTTVVVFAACTANEDAGQEPEESDTGETETDSNDAEAVEENPGEKILRLNNGVEPSSLDPSIGFDAVSWDPLNNLMEGLTRLNEESVAAEGVAESWDISEDGLTYTFHLREDANWSNGDPVVAEDFVYAWKYMLDPENASSAAFLGYFIKGGEAFNTGEGSADDVAVTAADEKTLEVVLEAPTGFFLDLLTNPAFFPINHRVAEENPSWHAEADTFVANGPFMLESWTHGTEMVFAKNPEYWDAEAVKLDKVHFAMVNDTNTQYQMFETGELDTATIPPELSDQLIDGDNVYIGNYGGLEFFRFNITEEPFQNKKIRQAIAYAINRQDIADYVVKTGVDPAYGFVSPGFTTPSGGDFREENGDLVTFDPDLATQLLEEGMAEEGYEELPPIVLSYNTTDLNKAVAETVQGMLSDNLGIDVTLENQEWNVFAEAQQNLELQFSRSSFINDYSDPVNFLESFITDSYMNRTGWSNAEYDELIANGKSETDEEKRYEYLYEAERLLAEEMIAVPLRYYNTVVLQADGVEGILRHPVGYFDLKYADKN
ncbi:peptide ABC transporter substrate-binding protein [Oceanobacillus profundus]|uniref:Peptide ABC transporter substrate-binding protein n=1 Tax=Oceanobacillus profundus TaxID=372463 RepID=A0A417YNS5_9BACI|nr:peptide ABC transporter substrate-binding protein [Oceanobacillus profundus]MCM3398867.1 peptide ABC transporter substrate-binding protein [Oceanobacillus profundus]PAE30496.1 oligopeptide ABC transporter substrate-binding protein [Paenibacillus sp. 7884-2]RHW35472.1 peptide ABC transporter substrate-binding protein [Oceanobacillus profundus]